MSLIVANHQDLQRLHSQSIHHRQVLEDKGYAGCFYCLQQFPSVQISQWIDVVPHPLGVPEEPNTVAVRGNTALCPCCGVDAVLPDQGITPSETAYLLERMHEHWFQCPTPRHVD